MNDATGTYRVPRTWGSLLLDAVLVGLAAGLFLSIMAWIFKP